MQLLFFYLGTLWCTIGNFIFNELYFVMVLKTDQFNIACFVWNITEPVEWFIATKSRVSRYEIEQTENSKKRKRLKRVFYSHRNRLFTYIHMEDPCHRIISVAEDFFSFLAGDSVIEKMQNSKLWLDEFTTTKIRAVDALTNHSLSVNP